jgi:hypothetical protein
VGGLPHEPGEQCGDQLRRVGPRGELLTAGPVLLGGHDVATEVFGIEQAMGTGKAPVGEAPLDSPARQHPVLPWPSLDDHLSAVDQTNTEHPGELADLEKDGLDGDAESTSAPQRQGVVCRSHRTPPPRA